MFQTFASWGASLRSAWNFIRAAVRQPFVTTQIVGLLSEEPFVLSFEEVEIASTLAITIQQAAKYIDMLPQDQIIPHLAYEPMGYSTDLEYHVNAKVTTWNAISGELEDSWLQITSDDSLSRNDWLRELTSLAEQYGYDIYHEGFEISDMEYTRR